MNKIAIVLFLYLVVGFLTAEEQCRVEYTRSGPEEVCYLHSPLFPGLSLSRLLRYVARSI